jgi:hypothetical protein
VFSATGDVKWNPELPVSADNVKSGPLEAQRTIPSVETDDVEEPDADFILRTSPPSLLMIHQAEISANPSPFALPSSCQGDGALDFAESEWLWSPSTSLPARERALVPRMTSKVGAARASVAPSVFDGRRSSGFGSSSIASMSSNERLTLTRLDWGVLNAGLPSSRIVSVFPTAEVFSDSLDPLPCLRVPHCC